MRFDTKTIPALLLGMVLACSTCGLATADTLFTTEIVANNFLSIDSETGLTTVIGPLGFGTVSGLSFQPGTGVLYGVATTEDQLITIDPLTGAGTAAGAGTLGAGTNSLTDIAFAPDGTLYGYDPIPAALVTIDLITGLSTPVVPNPPFVLININGLAFSPDGTLFATDSSADLLYTVDLVTGALTEIGVLNVNGQNFDGVAGIAFAPDGTLFGVSFAARNLVTIDTTTADVTVIGGDGATMFSLAFEAGDSVAIPAPGALALAVPMFGLLFRRKTSTA